MKSIKLAGNVTIQVVKLSNGDFGILASQVCSLLGIETLTANTYFNRLVDGVVILRPYEGSAEMVMSVEDFKNVMFHSALNGNKTAIDLTKSLLGLSLNVVFCEAYKTPFEFSDWSDFAHYYNIRL
jgi:hypothetical protein